MRSRIRFRWMLSVERAQALMVCEVIPGFVMMFGSCGCGGSTIG